jgi:rhodanese-related sulfurtransferase
MTETRQTATSLDADQVARLLASGSARVLDVREPEEFTGLGHIPGALLLPVDLVPSAVATLPRDGRPLIVCCEHGVRSVRAAALLVQAGIDPVINMRGGMSVWRGPRDFAPAAGASDLGPSSWLLESADLLPRGGDAIDLACGRGRHALLLAAAGFRVRAIDRDPGRIEFLREAAGRLHLDVTAQVIDLEAGAVDLGEDAADLIVCVHYLHRPLFPAIVRALRRSGILLYETFTVEQAARGGPTNPDFLLRHDELPRLVAPLEVLRRREGETQGRMVAAIAARKC